MARIKPTNEYFLKKSLRVHGDKFDYSLVEYEGSHIKVKIKCPKGHLFEQNPMDHWRGFGCKFCNYQRHINNIKYTKDEIIKLLQEKYLGGKFEVGEYKNTSTKIDLICPFHGKITKSVAQFLKGWGCAKCKGLKSKLDNRYFIEKSKKIHGSLYDYSLINIKSSQIKVEIICLNHGVFIQSPNSHLMGQGCPKCEYSKGELKIMNYLNKNEVKFEGQKTFEDCKNIRKLPFDFYLPQYNLLIEYDGEYHYQIIKNFDKGDENKLELRKKKDEIKNKFCKDNNIKLLRIPYWEINNIEKLLEINLKNSLAF